MDFLSSYFSACLRTYSVANLKFRSAQGAAVPILGPKVGAWVSEHTDLSRVLLTLSNL